MTKEELKKKIFNFLEEMEKKTIRKNKKEKELLTIFSEYKKVLGYENDYKDILKEDLDESEKKIILEEVDSNKKKKEELTNSIKNQILEKDSNKQNIVMEIRPGVGGTEAGIFTRDLYRMYQKFSEKKRWKVEIVESKMDSMGNLTFISFLVKGNNAFKYLKNEAGVHRVQRIPQTENKGRVHTSTASVVVLPEAKDLVVNIKSQDLRIDTYRSSGAGGQHVNTTDSAVRITHIPTGVVATSQDGRSQHDNKEKALFILKSRILEKQQREIMEKEGNMRSSMIGNSERSEKIRTYNFPQNRVTDHRLNLTLNKLNFVMDGNLENICQGLMDYEIEHIVSDWRNN